MAQPTTEHRYESLVAEGREAVLDGNRDRARPLLEAALRIDPDGEEALLWLAGVQTEPAEMVRYLRRVLAINPENAQAHEGMQWVVDQFGPIESIVPPPRPVEAAPPEPVVLRPRVPARSSRLLLETALLPFSVGALLGLARVVGWLRPATLATLRGASEPPGIAGAALIALLAAIGHGAALILAWLALGWLFDRARLTGRGDRFDSLLQTGAIWGPGLISGVALLLAGLGLRLGAGAWMIVAALCWLIVLGGAALIGRRLYALLAAQCVPPNRRRGVLARLVGVTLIVALLGFGVAGLIALALLRA